MVIVMNNKSKIIILSIILIGIISSIIIYLIMIDNKKTKVETNDAPVTKNISEEEQAYINIGYSLEETQNIIKYMSKKNQDKILNNKYQDITKYYQIKNFDFDNIERYRLYEEENKDLSLDKVITYVNLYLDENAYLTTEEIVDKESILSSPNKHYSLGMYEPLDLVTLNRAVGSNNKMRKEASTHLEELLSYAEENGHIMYPYSAYRSYDEQSRLYTNYKNRDGEEEADTYSARPGFSDHQTGLTTDIRSSNLGDRLNDDDLEFMINNSYKYGFILRYPEGKENITRYVYENWHYRYVGIEAAKIIHDNDLTLDEYYDLYVKEY